MRQIDQFPVDDLALVKRKLLHWAAAHPVCVYLDSNSDPELKHGTWECLVAVGVLDAIETNAGRAFADLQAFMGKKQDWLFGYLAYDLKNEVENLHSQNFDGIALPDLYFFQPEIVLGIPKSSLDFQVQIFSHGHSPERIWTDILNTPTPAELPVPQVQNLTLTPRLPKADYLAAVEAVRRHIIEGDVYEMNLCQEFFAEQADLEPLPTFERLNTRAQAPFAAYFQKQQHYLLGASPERFLQKKGHTLVSQPIKGTRKRDPEPEEDARIREELRNSIKDRAENVMIVDLVRNDLARHCLPGSVQVEELFGIYAFQTVFQMISTITGTLRPGVHPVLALRDAFPMGSMTGAPKVMAMELIEKLEQTRRGLYSGAVGYFTPEGDFDFNVVIRSILYNAQTAYLSCQVGGAIVYDSVPEQEYQECLIKARALLEALGAKPVI